MANAPHKFKTGVAVTGAATVNADEVTTNTAAQTLTNKGIDGSNNTITNIPETALPSNIDAAKIADGSVSNAEFQFIGGLTSDAQTQIDAKLAAAEKGAANGVATLDGNSKIPSSQLPAIAITEVFSAADITARDALTIGSGDGEVQEGDVVVVTDASADSAITSGAASYIYDGSAYVLLKADDEVLSVNGETGVVTLDANDVNAANQTLSNLTSPVALNQDLLPASNLSSALGSSTLAFSDLHADNIRNTNDGGVAIDVSVAGQVIVNDQLTTSALVPNANDTFNFGTPTLFYGNIYANQFSGRPTAADQFLVKAASFTTGGGSGLANDVTAPSGAELVGAFKEEGLQRNVGVVTNSHTTGLNTGAVHLETGNLSTASGTNNTGNILIRTGTNATAGNRGQITLEANADDTRLAAQPTGSEALAVATTDYVDTAVAGAGTASAGDIAETSFAMAENQTDQNVTGLAFANATVRSAKVHASVLVDATADLYEAVELLIIQKGASWELSQMGAGDNSEVSFDIDASGQVTYSSGTYAGFTAGTIKFRAITTSV